MDVHNMYVHRFYSRIAGSGFESLDSLTDYSSRSTEHLLHVRQKIEC